MWLPNVATSLIPIDGAPLVSTLIILTLFYLQRDVSRKATARAVLQAYALPNRSFRRNIEAAQRQYESMWMFLFLFVPILSPNFQISKF